MPSTQEFVWVVVVPAFWLDLCSDLMEAIKHGVSCFVEHFCYFGRSLAIMV